MKNIKKCIYFTIILFIFMIYLIMGIDKNKKDSIEISLNNEQWALKNYGQKIKGSKGIKGIDINIQKAWEISTGNPNVLVAVIDSGVDISCKGLKKAIYAQGKESWDFYYNDNTIYDEYIQDYHGTYISSTIVGYDEENKVYGVAPNVSLLPIKFLRGTKGNTQDMIKAINYACEKGSNIINCSWNFNDYNEELYKLIADHPNTLFVCSAGNTNMDLDVNNIYPACYDLDNIITVLAIDNCGNVYNSSGRGKNVDIAAPGVNIIAVFPEDDVTYVSGTSISTAYISGVAALMLSINNSLSPKLIKKIMTDNARKIDGLDQMCESKGIVDAYKCLKIVNNDYNK